ncbi:adhesion G- coupled receptor G7 [Paramuricea clavata]|uniref:XK-related protein n=1 Tax=Paramuricea clavata TaxID=317549 RepID=A0A6S7K3X1_PARCT|nr:adhesion G- coupled receptor G7 [Paramuricea clavata]
MRGKKELFMLITGLVLFIFDLVTDIVVAAQYRVKGDYWWFGLTLFFIIVPLFIVSLMAWVNSDDWFCVNCCLLFVCSSMFVRYVEELKYWKQAYWDNPPCGDNYKKCNCPDCKHYRAAITKSNKSAYNLALVRYVETLTESTPQCCLQIYIMLRQWDFPWLTVLSTVISLLSLAWSITAVEKARANKNNHNFTLPATVVLFVSQLFSLSSRLFAIAAFAYVFKAHVFTALAVHWLIVHFAIWLIGEDCDVCKCDAVGNFFVYITLSFPFLVNVSDVVLRENSSLSTMHFLLSVENVLLAILAVTIPATPDVKHMSVLRPIVLSSVIISVVLGTIFHIVYNKLLKPTEPHKSDEEEPHKSDEEQPHKSDEEEPHKSNEEESHKSDEEEPHESNEEEPHKSDGEEPHESNEEKPHKSDEEEPHKSNEEEPHKSDEEEPHESNKEEPHKSDEEEPHKSDEEEPHKSDEEEPHESNEEEPHKSDEEQPHKSDEEQPHKSNKEEPHKSNEEEPHKSNEEEPHKSDEEQPHKSDKDETV